MKYNVMIVTRYKDVYVLFENKQDDHICYKFEKHDFESDEKFNSKNNKLRSEVAKFVKKEYNSFDSYYNDDKLYKSVSLIEKEDCYIALVDVDCFGGCAHRKEYLSNDLFKDVIEDKSYQAIKILNKKYKTPVYTMLLYFAVFLCIGIYDMCMSVQGKKTIINENYLNVFSFALSFSTIAINLSINKCFECINQNNSKITKSIKHFLPLYFWIRVKRSIVFVFTVIVSAISTGLIVDHIHLVNTVFFAVFALSAFFFGLFYDAKKDLEIFKK